MRMKVKILLFPLSVVVAIALMIFWVKPEVVAVLDLRAQTKNAHSTLDQMNTIVSNIDTLDRSLNENAGNESFVLTYLPQTGSDDRLLDEVNFLASESGLLFTSVGMKRISSEVVQAAEAASQAIADQAELKAAAPSQEIFSGGESISLPTFVSSSPNDRLRSVDVSVTAFGRYEQIKDFVDRIYHANHFQNFLTVDIVEKPEVKDQQSTDVALPMESGALGANITIRFGYLSKINVPQGTLLVAFQQPRFDFGPVDRLRQRVTREISPLDALPSSRPNPFLR